MIPTWTRWPFRVLRVGAFVMAVAAVLFALAGDWWPVATTTGIAAFIAVYPWTWKTAYRLGYANGQLEAQEQLMGAWNALADTADRMKADGT